MSRTSGGVLKCGLNMDLLLSESSISRRSVAMEKVVLVTEDVVVNVVLLCWLRGQDKRLDERTHRSVVVRQLTDHLTDINRRLSIMSEWVSSVLRPHQHSSIMTQRRTTKLRSTLNVRVPDGVVPVVPWPSGRQWPTLRLTQPTWAVSPPVGCHHLHPPSPIIITCSAWRLTLILPSLRG